VPATLDHAGAALAAARAAGLTARGADVVAVAANVLVRVDTDDGPVAARLAGATSSFRDPAATLGREARLAAALAAAGAPVPAPLGGPYEAGGRVVTLWPWLRLSGSAGDAEAAGPALAACHAVLAASTEPLEPLGMLVEARRLAEGAPAEVRAVLLPAADRALAELDGAPLRPVHGDSHPGNVLWTAGGPLWADWEDAHLAPLEWDLACLVASARLRGDDFGWAQAALEAHGGPCDAALLEACVHARTVQGAAYVAYVAPRDAARAEMLRRRLEWLRGR
jgi:aminoglycoside phosphotransferase (APT) family kinase protein